MRTADESPVVGHRAAFRDGVPNFRLAEYTPGTDLVFQEARFWTHNAA
jgi:hypothetical protein